MKKNHMIQIAICLLLVFSVLIVAFSCGRNPETKGVISTLPSDTQPEPEMTAQESVTPSEETSTEKPTETKAETTTRKPPAPPPASEQPEEPTENPAAYQAMYPDLYVQRPEQRIPDGERLPYLTFDDGPSKHTEEILDILDANGIKGTFFVVYRTDAYSRRMYQEIVNRGHTLAIHSASHEYKQIYSSVASFLDDFNKIYAHLYQITGVKCTMFRFPGGSNTDYNRKIRKALTTEMKRRGFTYWDWNVDSGDADKSVSRETVYQKTVSTMKVQNRSVVLMHDAPGKIYTVQALPDVIRTLKERGYQFCRLEDTMKAHTFDRE